MILLTLSCSPKLFFSQVFHDTIQPIYPRLGASKRHFSSPTTGVRELSNSAVGCTVWTASPPPVYDSQNRSPFLETAIS